MANYRPKSLNELNQVYGKAMKAEKAIKEGSLSLTKEDEQTENPSDNIFLQMQQQVSQNQKQEIYDADIANIANDFIKRFTENEKPKAEAPKQLKRPAPSIKALYHTPVKPEQTKAEDIPFKAQSSPLSSSFQPISPESAVKPKAPESLTPAFVAAPKIENKTENEVAPVPAPAAANEPTVSQESTSNISNEQFAHSSPAIIHRDVSPTVHITSTERSSLMEEYQRVMSDEEDDDDVFIEKKAKKRGLFSRKKKYREENEDAFDNIADDSQADTSYEEPQIAETKFDSSNISLADNDTEYPAEEQEPMNLYDYIEADFDFEEKSEEKPEEKVEDSLEENEDEFLPMSNTPAEEIVEEATPAETTAEPIAFSMQAAQEEINEALKEAVEDIADEEALNEASYDEFEEETDFNEAVIVPEEIVEDSNIENEPESFQEASPTAGMVFDDVFSVTDESKRSYSGGNWADVFGENENQNSDTTTEDESSGDEEQESEEYTSYEDEENYTEEDFSYNPPVKKKKSFALKLTLSILTALLVICTAAVIALGSFVAPNTGKLFLNKYRAFTSEQDFPFIGVSDGDLVITEDDGSYAEEGDAFVYVNHEAQSFMMGKHSGSTSSSDGDIIFIAENEAGRVLVLREDTLGVISQTYKGVGSIIGPISDNYIIISAILLILILACVLAMIIPSSNKSGKKGKKQPQKESSSAFDYSEDEEDNDSAENDEQDEDFDFDPDGIEEGLFSGI